MDTNITNTLRVHWASLSLGNWGFMGLFTLICHCPSLRHAEAKGLKAKCYKLYRGTEPRNTKSSELLCALNSSCTVRSKSTAYLLRDCFLRISWRIVVLYDMAPRMQHLAPLALYTTLVLGLINPATELRKLSKDKICLEKILGQTGIEHRGQEKSAQSRRGQWFQLDLSK